MATPGDSSSSVGYGIVPIVNLPRIPCPKCNLKVIRCLSKKNEVYYKCPNHFPNGETCGYYWYEGKYLEYLRGNHPELLGNEIEELEQGVAGSGGLGGGSVQAAVQAVEHKDMNMEIMDLRLQISEIKTDIAKLKLEVRDVKQVEVKNPICMENVYVAVLLVGLVVALLGALWKK